jgi:hypothetical protein
VTNLNMQCSVYPALRSLLLLIKGGGHRYLCLIFNPGGETRTALVVTGQAAVQYIGEGRTIGGTRK